MTSYCRFMSVPKRTRQLSSHRSYATGCPICHQNNSRKKILANHSFLNAIPEADSGASMVNSHFVRTLPVRAPRSEGLLFAGFNPKRG
jgi:hypothetical protein